MVYHGAGKEEIDFQAIHNLFHPITLDDCFVSKSFAEVGGIKTLDEKGKYTWNTQGHPDRLIRFREAEMRLLAQVFEDSVDFQSVKLVSIHAQGILDILDRLSDFKGKVKDSRFMASECWHESGAQKKNQIRRETRFPEVEGYEMIYSGPHFYVANPFYKTPREICKLNSDYDPIDLESLPEDFWPRTNYVPHEELDKFKQRQGHYPDENSLWIDQFKLAFSNMIWLGGERTLQAALIPPKVSHINGVFSMAFKQEPDLVEFAALSASLPLDFLTKLLGRANLQIESIKGYPLGVREEYRTLLSHRVLRLNCLTRAYAGLWERQWQEAWATEAVGWSVADPLLPAAPAAQVWSAATPLRTAYARRWALLELDVLAAMALGLRLKDLELMYRTQFPVLEQNDRETFYDQQGRIVFTVSKGLTGVGLDRGQWKEAQTSAQPYADARDGRLYHPPYTLPDRLADYARAWAHFEAHPLLQEKPIETALKPD